MNTRPNDTVASNQFPSYKLETDNLDILDGHSRTGILVHKDLHYSRRRDLETLGTSTVWLKLAYPGRKPVLIQGLYRQFRRIGRQGSHLPAQQHQRWNSIITKWEISAQKGHEIITMGDTNLNLYRWNLPDNQRNSYDKINAPMSNLLQERILNKGFLLLNNTPTRTKDTADSKDSCIDMMFTNRTDKIAQHRSGITGFSDHTIQLLVRTTNKLMTNQKYIRLRCFKNFSIQQYRENIINHFLYIETLHEQDPSKITENIQTIMQESLQTMAPVKLIQTSKKNSVQISVPIREKMAERDLAKQDFLISGCQEDLRFHKNFKK